jgi:hypothetical protein
MAQKSKINVIQVSTTLILTDSVRLTCPSFSKYIHGEAALKRSESERERLHKQMATGYEGGGDKNERKQKKVESRQSRWKTIDKKLKCIKQDRDEGREAFAMEIPSSSVVTKDSGSTARFEAFHSASSWRVTPSKTSERQKAK